MTRDTLTRSWATATSAALETAPALAGGPRLLPGALLAQRYRIVSALGHGAMGEVYRCEDQLLGQPVAIKVLPRSLADDPGRLARVFDEVRLARRVTHPNVCRVHDIAMTEAGPTIAMELVEGEDLASILRRTGPLPPDDVLRLARGILAGLAASHERGVLHRDLKPANILLDANGTARLTDFGVAALATGERDAAGTPAYMAPELLEGGAATAQSDLFSVGMLLAELATGRRPVKGTTLPELRAAHAQARPIEIAGLDPGLAEVVRTCLAPDPAQRPVSARLVLARVGGADAIDAAAAAGEIVTPEMLAATDVEPLRAWQAAALLCAVAVLLAAVTRVFDRIAGHALAPPLYTAEELRSKALDQARQLGAPALPVRLAAIEAEPGVLGWGWSMGIQPADLHPSLFQLAVRTGPEPLLSLLRLPREPWDVRPPQVGRVTWTEPPPRPGSVDVLVDGHGRLSAFRRRAPFDPPLRAPDWPAVFGLAGLDYARFRPASPTPHDAPDAEARFAWTGPPSTGSWPVRVEAGTWQGGLAWLEVTHDRTPIERRLFASYGVGAQRAMVVAVALSAWIAIVLALRMVRRNLALGRGDRRGANRVAGAVTLLLVASQVLRVDGWGGGWLEAAEMLLEIFAHALLRGVGAWVFYLAMEPALRQSQPRRLLSWARGVAGRVTDPLVARDVLLGLVFGIAMILVWNAVDVLTVQPPIVLALSTLGSARHLGYYLLVTPVQGLVHSLVVLCLTQAFQRPLGRWAFLPVTILVFTITYLTTWGPDALVVPVSALTAILTVGVILHGGLLAGTVCWSTAVFLSNCPLTSSPENVMFVRSATILAATFLVAALAAVRSTRQEGVPA